MEKGTCENTDCTVAKTGICLLSNPDPLACVHFKQQSQIEVPAAEGGDPLPQTRVQPKGRRFHGGLEMGTDEAAELMRSRYAHLIGILGSWDAGKTCFLSSLYLMAAHGGLMPDYRFAGSRTLQGFEDRARRTRSWTGTVLPDKLADHTRLSDPRTPALMHIALQETRAPSRRVELLLTDLPGEWSKNLIDRADSAMRFEFLHRADGIVIVVDGPVLASDARYAELARVKMLAGRLAETVQLDRAVPVMLVLSKCDQIDMNEPQAARDLLKYVSDLGFRAEIVLTAAFSGLPEKIENGTGVLRTIKAIIDDVPIVTGGTVCGAMSVGDRMFENFRA